MSHDRRGFPSILATSAASAGLGAPRVRACDEAPVPGPIFPSPNRGVSEAGAAMHGGPGPTRNATQ